VSAATLHSPTLPLRAMINSIPKHKVENAILYLAERLQRLSESKATTLLYLADEYAVRKTGAPILWLSYRADLNGISIVEDFPTQLLRSPIKTFVDDEFSDCEINILQNIVDCYGRYTDNELVEILTREDTLWNRTRTTSGALIDFTLLLDTDYKKAVFEMAYKFQNSVCHRLKNR
jgi:uncharacterized phage-associated protein